MDFHALAERVRTELIGYEIHGPHPDQFGEPLPPEWFEKGLSEMQAALVPPHRLEMHYFDKKLGQVFVMEVVAVADDGEGTLLDLRSGARGRLRTSRSKRRSGC